MVFGASKKSDKKGRDFPAYQPPKKETVAVEQPSAASFIGKTMNIEGGLVSDEDLTIEGRVKGTIEVSKTLTIGRYGDVTADINARVVKIIGKARGNIVASDKVEILSEGRYNGNIMSEKLVVAEGAVLIGNINQEEEAEPVSPDTAKKKKQKTKSTPPPEPETEQEPTDGEKKEDDTGTTPPETETEIENETETDTEDASLPTDSETENGEPRKDEDSDTSDTYTDK